MVSNKLVKPCSSIQPLEAYSMMTFNGVKNTIFLLEQQCRTQVVIEESKRDDGIGMHACMTPPGMLLSDSLEPDLSHTSILYCLDVICMSTLINDVKRTLVNKLGCFCQSASS
jgi:hypothetical protein